MEFHSAGTAQNPSPPLTSDRPPAHLSSFFLGQMERPAMSQCVLDALKCTCLKKDSTPKKCYRSTLLLDQDRDSLCQPMSFPSVTQSNTLASAMIFLASCCTDLVWDVLGLPVASHECSQLVSKQTARQTAQRNELHLKKITPEVWSENRFTLLNGLKTMSDFEIFEVPSTSPPLRRTGTWQELLRSKLCIFYNSKWFKWEMVSWEFSRSIVLQEDGRHLSSLEENQVALFPLSFRMSSRAPATRRSGMGLEFSRSRCLKINGVPP